ncbi:glycosyltransferase family 2 protein [Sphingomonas sp.]|jgi:glycosyltransferase involved in cell wall biosynthesis|uniref:glycosyltransferase family 2 protein n=1 Tax=Sphingomonas sp. TaxID=28214 RepID=UPI002EDBB6C3
MVDLAQQPRSTQYDLISSELIWGPGASGDAEVTIAIPTFNRSHLVRESLASALAQRTSRRIETIVVDNQSAPEHRSAILAFLNETKPANVSVYVNAENIGMFGNWNRCLELAKTKWINLLNDDDLLKPQFVEQTLAALEKTGAPAVVADCEMFDQRVGQGRSGHKLTPVGIKQIVRRFLHGGKRLWQVGPRHLFWGNLLGNTIGLMGDRALMLEQGGFLEADFPTADYAFYARWSVHRPLYRLDETLGALRIAENESSRLETQLGFIDKGHALRLALIEGGHVPASWRKYLPLLIADDIYVATHHWAISMDIEAVFAKYGMSATKSSWLRLRMLRLRQGVVT